MKKARRILLCLLLCLSLAGCGILPDGGSPEAAKEKKTYIYYLNRKEDQLEKVNYTFKESDLDARIMEMIAMQAKKPSSKKLVNLLPEETAVLSYKISDTTLRLNLSDSYREMPLTRQILARGGLVRTFTQIDGIDSVLFTVDGRTMKDSSGQVIGPMSAENFVVNSDKTINSYQSVNMMLYFTDETGTKLVPEKRKVYFSSSEPVEKAVVEEILKGPSVSGHYAVLDSGTNIISVMAHDGLCYVNFDNSVRNSPLSVREDVLVYAIVNSLVDTCKVRKVQFSVSGKNSGVIRNTMELSQQYKRNAELISS
jgi:germination protein M